MSKLVDMKCEEQKVEEKSCEPCMVEKPKYPYGLELRLEEESLKKLGIKELPPIGKYVMITARAEVVATSAYESKQGGENRCLSLQIQELGVEAEKNKKSAAESLYETEE